MKNNRIKLGQVAHHLNLPRVIATHLIGPRHSRFHQCLIGALVMLLAMESAIILKHHTIEDLHAVIDTLFGMLHGMGLTPYVELMIEIAEEEV